LRRPAAGTLAAMRGDSEAMLGTYLQDHHAGATAGLALARRAAGANEGSSYGAELSRVAAEIEQDLETMETVMEQLGVKPHVFKDRVAWAAEKMGRLKPNNRLLGYSPLSRVIELEGLVIGVTGKLALWEALGAVAGERITGVDLAALATRAQDQRKRLDRLRHDAARDAFAPS
jgi:hypothetical protein